jgi:hypothetical protein
MLAMFGKMKLVALAGVAATGLAFGSQTASAHDHLSFGISLAFPTPVFVAPAPVIVQPAPVCQPAPTVVYQPAPVVIVQPAPVYYHPFFYGGWDHRGYGWHR